MGDDNEHLKGFLLLAKSAKGAACAALIKQVLDHPSVYVFGELLDMPNVQELAGTTAAPSLELLKIFCFGTWNDYKKSTALHDTPLTDAQATKLKKLTVVSLASQSKTLQYDVLMRELEMASVREIEDTLIDCIYCGLIQGRLDQAERQIDIFSAMSRDVDPSELPGLSDMLLQWHAGSIQLMSSVSEQLQRFKSQQDEARAEQTELDKKIDAVKVTLRANHDMGDAFGASDLDSRMDFDGDEKMRKSGRLKVRHGASGASGSKLGSR